MAKLISVKVKRDAPGQNIELNKALKTFKKRVMDSGHIQETRERGEFIKPSVKKRKQKQQAVRIQYLRDLEEKQRNSN